MLSETSATNDDGRWFILGAGAIGCLWAAKLFQHTIPVTLLVRPERPIQGMTLHYTHDNKHAELPVPLQTTENPNPIHNVIVTTKASDTLTALKDIQSRLATHATIVLLQNGMGSQQQVADSFSNHPVYAGSTTDGAWLSDYLHVHKAGQGQTWIGAFNEVAQSQKTATNLNILKEMTGENLSFTDSITEKLQEKLAINSAINAMTALHQCPNGELLQPEHQAIISNLCQETETILAADGYRSSKPLLAIVNHVLSITAANFSSSLQDVRFGRKTELHWINGYLLSRAEYHQIPAPTHRKLMETLAEQGIH